MWRRPLRRPNSYRDRAREDASAGGHELFLYRASRALPSKQRFDHPRYCVPRPRGLRGEQYDEPGLKTDAKGIATFEGEAKVAYFKDPDGHTLSIARAPRS